MNLRYESRYNIVGKLRLGYATLVMLIESSKLDNIFII